MSVPKTNLHPPSRFLRASHAIFTSRDLAKGREFYTEVLGLLVSDEDKETLYLRGLEERAHHSLAIKRTQDEPACLRVGMRVHDEDDLERAKHTFEDHGLPCRWADEPFQGRTLHTVDVVGTPLEDRKPRPTASRVSDSHGRRRLRGGADDVRCGGGSAVPSARPPAPASPTGSERAECAGQHARGSPQAAVSSPSTEMPACPREGERQSHLGELSLLDVSQSVPRGSARGVGPAPPRRSTIDRRCERRAWTSGVLLLRRSRGLAGRRRWGAARWARLPGAAAGD
jgi:catechol 2,3-dioxygenase-like lactoylglutathione lyase family enzyme